MKQIFLVVFILVFSPLTISSQSCLDEGITFTTQAQIDSFQNNYPGCTEIEGNVTINESNITNLNGLNMIIAIGQSLDISYNVALTNLNGLNSLTSLINLSIDGNNMLTDLTGLDNVDGNSIAALYIMNNSSLSSCEAQCICNFLANPQRGFIL